ncbi:Uncharacterised protein [Bordetella trematum]|nr:Uncharacterised protein [Bordetella trematum]
MRKALIRHQRHGHRQRGLSATSVGPGQCHGIEVGRLIYVEVHMHRVDRHNRGQQIACARRSAVDQIAPGHHDPVDTPGNRCRDTRVRQIKPRRRDRRPGHKNFCLTGLARGDGIVIGLARHGPRGNQPLSTLEIGLGLAGQRLGLTQLRRSRVERHLERPRIDLEKQLPFVHQTALGHADSVHSPLTRDLSSTLSGAARYPVKSADGAMMRWTTSATGSCGAIVAGAEDGDALSSPDDSPAAHARAAAAAMAPATTAILNFRRIDIASSVQQGFGPSEALCRNLARLGITTAGRSSLRLQVLQALDLLAWEGIPLVARPH